MLEHGRAELNVGQVVTLAGNSLRSYPGYTVRYPEVSRVYWEVS